MITRNTTRSPMRERILDAADRLLSRYGYPRTTADDLAREAGIGRRTIYLHFTRKEEIFLASIDRVVERLLSELRRIATTADTPDKKLSHILVTRVLFRFDSVHDYHLSLDDMFAVLRPSYLERREHYFTSEAHILAEVIAEGQRTGVLSTSHPLDTARTLLSATNSLLPYSLSGRELGSREDIERQAHAVADLLLRGLLHHEVQPVR